MSGRPSARRHRSPRTRSRCMPARAACRGAPGAAARWWSARCRCCRSGTSRFSCTRAACSPPWYTTAKAAARRLGHSRRTMWCSPPTARSLRSTQCSWPSRRRSSLLPAAGPSPRLRTLARSLQPRPHGGPLRPYSRRAGGGWCLTRRMSSRGGPRTSPAPPAPSRPSAGGPSPAPPSRITWTTSSRSYTFYDSRRSAITRIGRGPS
mmetsp:Transcript_24504/g.79109  ORF Transcript_24504/g.79109 Transcript_24504/m.79109 type:complete len:207 (-) Transcript_24504:420-1040(-)